MSHYYFYERRQPLYNHFSLPNVFLGEKVSNGHSHATRADSHEYSRKSARKFGESTQNSLANIGQSGESQQNGFANVGESGESQQNGLANVGESGESRTFPKKAILANVSTRKKWRVFGKYQNSLISRESCHCLGKSKLRLGLLINEQHNRKPTNFNF